jgi:hypothetical protein
MSPVLLTAIVVWQLVFGALPTVVSRGNSPALTHAMTSVLKGCASTGAWRGRQCACLHSAAAAAPPPGVHVRATFSLCWSTVCLSSSPPSHAPPGGRVLIVVFVPSSANALAAGYAVANAYPSFSVKSRAPTTTQVCARAHVRVPACGSTARGEMRAVYVRNTRGAEHSRAAAKMAAPRLMASPPPHPAPPRPTPNLAGGRCGGDP